ncbi:MAG: hypothetical protein HY023_15500 [Chloroflexi bacterium]|nr:hypothetical protein [Chloroflexota bacterium]
MRAVKHFSLHRIAGTELQVVADVENGVIPIIEVEEAVLRGYASRGRDAPPGRLYPAWPHRWVTLFILQDLRPLIRQLRPGAGLPPGEAIDLEGRPVVNVYDLADPTRCNVFVNRQVMVKEGYWDDLLAVQGLLAHEHGHPLAENETTRASRQLQMELSVDCDSLTGGGPTNRQGKIQSLLTALAEKLCIYAPREIFTNEIALLSGFGEALLHLDRRNLLNARRSVAGREELRRLLQREAGPEDRASSVAGLLLIGDLKGYLDLALEVAAFFRAGREAEAGELEKTLAQEVFPHLEPEAAQAYAALRRQYIALRADLAPVQLIAWSEGVLNILAKTLAAKGLRLKYRLGLAATEKDSTKEHEE